MKKNLITLAMCSAITLTGCPIKFDTGTIRSTSNDSDDEQALDISDIDQQMADLQASSENDQQLTKKTDETTKKVATTQAKIEQSNVKAIHEAVNASEKDKQLSSNQPPEWLMAHNTLRQLHATGGLTWSDAIAKRAKAYAETCPNGHSKGSGYGENIAYATGKVMSPTEVTNAWYDEISIYDYANPRYQKGTGHFTQVVWKGSTELGCGYKTGCTTGKWAEVWVCQYEKAGNYRDKFETNVLPALAKRTINPSAHLDVENLSLSKHEQKTIQSKITNNHEQANVDTKIDMNIKMDANMDIDIKTIHNADIDDKSIQPDKSWNFQNKPAQNESVQSQIADDTIYVPTVEVIDGEKVMQGDGFTISKKVE